mmetsp:Transcript_8177/g.22426  ORF Transcript_8177/g.22426 Transcript_8177/m.22426 type:complete len:368 (-) Transcript_8177:442-1545(-)
MERRRLACSVSHFTLSSLFSRSYSSQTFSKLPPMTPMGSASTQRDHTMKMLATTLPQSVVGVKTSPYPTVVAVTIAHQKHAGMDSKGLLAITGSQTWVTSFHSEPTSLTYCWLTESQSPCSAMYIKAPKMIMPRSRLRSNTYRALRERSKLRMMMITASKRRPRRKALTTRVRRITWMKMLFLPAPLIRSRYQGRIAHASTRFDLSKAKFATRRNHEGVLTASSATSSWTSFSLSMISPRVNADVTSRRPYSTVKNMTQKRSTSSKTGNGVGRQSGSNPASCSKRQPLCQSGTVETMKLPVETKMATKTRRDTKRPRMLRSASSRVRKMRSARENCSETDRSLQTEQNSYQPILPSLLTSYSMTSKS